jgi:DNA-binding LytR/AlgR family response regulator
MSKVIEQNLPFDTSRLPHFPVKWIQERKMIEDRLVLKSEGKILFIPVDEIDWLEAKDNSVCIHSKNETWKIRTHLNQLEEGLDPEIFVRMNRSVIVNLDFVRELKPWFGGTYQTILKDGTELVLSRNYKERLFSQIPHPLGIRSLRIAK